MPKEEAPADRKPSSHPTTISRRAMAANGRNVRSAIVLIKILVEVFLQELMRAL